MHAHAVKIQSKEDVLLCMHIYKYHKDFPAYRTDMNNQYYEHVTRDILWHLVNQDEETEWECSLCVCVRMWIQSPDYAVCLSLHWANSREENTEEAAVCTHAHTNKHTRTPDRELTYSLPEEHSHPTRPTLAKLLSESHPADAVHFSTHWVTVQWCIHTHTHTHTHTHKQCRRQF